MTRAALLAALALAGCRDRGVVDIAITLPAECTAPTHVGVYLMRGALCDNCRCGSCIDPCNDDTCIIGCGGDFCTFDEFASGGIDVTPDIAGSYAVVYQFVTIDPSTGDVTEVSAACVDEVQLDKDGTDDQSLDATAVCCE